MSVSLRVGGTTRKVIVGCSTLPFKALLLSPSSWDLMPELRRLPYWSSNMPSLPRLLALVHPVASASHLSPALPPTSHPSFQMQPKSSDFTHVVYAEIAILTLSHVDRLPLLPYTHSERELLNDRYVSGFSYLRNYHRTGHVVMQPASPSVKVHLVSPMCQVLR